MVHDLENKVISIVNDTLIGITCTYLSLPLS